MNGIACRPAWRQIWGVAKRKQNNFSEIEFLKKNFVKPSAQGGSDSSHKKDLI
jgi:hypothetical protein